MKRILVCLAALALPTLALGAEPVPGVPDPIGDLIAQSSMPASDASGDRSMTVTLYHTGRGIHARDSLGCPVAPMRTVAVDPAVVPRHSIIFIKETAGLPLPDGSVHDGLWYASDIGGAIRGARLDLFTGHNAASMRALSAVNMRAVSVSKVGEFEGCPPVDGGAAHVADNR